ncbi:GntR family transcriptional regulator [Cupriavidus pauculus]|uniref:GntR family transcriptional regulator n=1 Tax=Cupriavidus pauculus TaxID=82633 RepID=A0A2N5CA94_9BURK|nr:GntR family transcriptional regulator [Cupriavidus pauculus]PLP99126.1 GntR family transcriptional regulator [Cupriavidus pauculus]
MPSSDLRSPAAGAEAAPLAHDPLDAIVATLEEDIVFGRLHPRERLVEDDLMERFGVKRHVVRDALTALDRLGLVERRKNVGAVVRSFSVQEVTELYEVRGMLETEAARRIDLQRVPAHLDTLIAIQQQHDTAVAAGDARTVFRVNLAFHRELFSLCGNQTLQKAIAEFARQTHPIRFASLVSAEYRERARQEHWQMIEALKAGDIDGLVALCASHLLPSRDAYLNAQQYRG